MLLVMAVVVVVSRALCLIEPVIVIRILIRRVDPGRSWYQSWYSQERRKRITMMFHRIIQDVAWLGLHRVQDAVVIRHLLLVVRHRVRILAGRLRLNVVGGCRVYRGSLRQSLAQKRFLKVGLGLHVVTQRWAVASRSLLWWWAQTALVQLSSAVVLPRIARCRRRTAIVPAGGRGRRNFGSAAVHIGQPSNLKHLRRL